MRCGAHYTSRQDARTMFDQRPTNALSVVLSCKAPTPSGLQAFVVLHFLFRHLARDKPRASPPHTPISGPCDFSFPSSFCLFVRMFD
eukprot:m.96891 g.96891  ORF g.96891 m.96891 type:complete len:87 (-) comp8807_c0_seq1:189-449(-)